MNRPVIRITDIEPYLCRIDATTRDVLARLNATDHLFQLVVDRDRHLLGTVTDGDVRRAILNGAGLDELVERCVHRNPIVGRTGNGAANQEKLRKIGGYKAFLPVVDADGRIQKCWSPVRRRRSQSRLH